MPNLGIDVTATMLIVDSLGSEKGIVQEETKTVLLFLREFASLDNALKDGTEGRITGDR